jgi:hypothetical protein
MISLFVLACGIPAAVRFGELLSRTKDGLTTLMAILAVIGVLTKTMEPALYC